MRRAQQCPPIHRRDAATKAGAACGANKPRPPRHGDIHVTVLLAAWVSAHRSSGAAMLALKSGCRPRHPTPRARSCPVHCSRKEEYGGRDADDGIPCNTEFNERDGCPGLPSVAFMPLPRSPAHPWGISRPAAIRRRPCTARTDCLKYQGRRLCLTCSISAAIISDEIMSSPSASSSTAIGMLEPSALARPPSRRLGRGERRGVCTAAGFGAAVLFRLFFGSFMVRVNVVRGCAEFSAGVGCILFAG